MAKRYLAPSALTNKEGRILNDLWRDYTTYRIKGDMRGAKRTAVKIEALAKSYGLPGGYKFDLF